MEFHSPPHPSILWHAGSTPCNLSPSRHHKVDDLLHGFPPLPEGDPLDPAYMDRMRCKQNLQKLFEDTNESSYDLSLKDIVDPCYSISGHLKVLVTEAGAEDARRSHCRKGASIPKLAFSLSFSGLRGKSKHAQANPHAGKVSPSCDGKDGETPQLPPCTKNLPSKCPRSSSGSSAPSMSRVHPSNQCSTCSTYTIFFKCRCLICGRLYCSNCARECMEIRADGFICRESCKNRFLSKKISQKIRSGCWPFGNGF